jgi:hypothetical protein
MADDKFLLKKHPTLNPYLTAGELIFRRLKWDLMPQSWRSRRKLKELKNRYSGEKAVIVCNGPSLLKTDFSLLVDIYCFGLNKINLLFENQSWRPSSIVAINRFVIEQNADFFNQTDIPLFIDSKGIKSIRSRDNIIYLHSSGPPKFARDCTVSICQGYTVTFVAMQLAFHMGFKAIALIGCDHRYDTRGTPSKTVTSGEIDHNHFDPHYFANGKKWQLPDLLNSEVFYTLARDIYQQDGRYILNATEGGNLDVFPRITLERFLRTNF